MGSWSGLTVFIVGGGLSVLDQNLDLLRGRKVIAINSSFSVVPFADVLFFGDARWWRENRTRVISEFRGELVTADEISEQAVKLRLLKRKAEWSDDPNAAFVRRTSVTGAINWGFHQGAFRFVLLGIDGGPVRGRTHHHEPHSWTLPDSWVAEQRKDFAALDGALKARGIEVINASPCSTVPFWPKAELEDVV